MYQKLVKERNKASKKDGECWGGTEKETRMKLLERITMEGPIKKAACEQRPLRCLQPMTIKLLLVDDPHLRPQT